MITNSTTTGYFKIPSGPEPVEDELPPAYDDCTPPPALPTIPLAPIPSTNYLSVVKPPNRGNISGRWSIQSNAQQASTNDDAVREEKQTPNAFLSAPAGSVNAEFWIVGREGVTIPCTTIEVMNIGPKAKGAQVAVPFINVPTLLNLSVHSSESISLALPTEFTGLLIIDQAIDPLNPDSDTPPSLNSFFSSAFEGRVTAINQLTPPRNQDLDGGWQPPPADACCESHEMDEYLSKTTSSLRSSNRYTYFVAPPEATDPVVPTPNDNPIHNLAAASVATGSTDWTGHTIHLKLLTQSIDSACLSSPKLSRKKARKIRRLQQRCIKGKSKESKSMIWIESWPEKQEKDRVGLRDERARRRLLISRWARNVVGAFGMLCVDFGVLVASCFCVGIHDDDDLEGNY